MNTPRPSRRWRGRARVALLCCGGVFGFVGFLDVYGGVGMEARSDGALLLVAALILAGCHATDLHRATGRALRWWARLGADVTAFGVGAWTGNRLLSNIVLQPVLAATSAFVLVLLALAVFLAWEDHRSPPWVAAGPAPAATAPAAGPVPGPRPPVPDAATAEGPSARAGVLAAAVGAAATLLAAALALPQFWYTARYAPSTAPPIVSVGTTLDDIEVVDDHMELTLEIEIENKGSTAVRMLTSLYEVTATPVRVADRPLPAGDPAQSYDGIFGGDYGAAGRVNSYAAYGTPQQIQVGSVGEDNAWIGPDETYRTTLRVQGPRDGFDLLRATVDVIVARADRVETEEGHWPSGRRLFTCGDGDVLMAENRRPLAHTGVFDRLTESDREVVTFWVLSDPAGGDASPWWSPFPWAGVSLQHTGHGCAHALRTDEDGLEDRAMVGRASAVAEAAMPEPEPEPEGEQEAKPRP
ncbi:MULTISPECIES: hypothetical protein [unclassified Streptomyces]|uniref:hypothetical protein n=1 Tax=unclassified Streptomyces TaxID=2593676 RepID=UPI003805BFFE